jgi:hypothetical protein
MTTPEQLGQIRRSLRAAERHITTAILNAQAAGDREWEARLQRLGLNAADLREQAAEGGGS